jgi:hypothetical protein
MRLACGPPILDAPTAQRRRALVEAVVTSRLFIAGPSGFHGAVLY